MGHFGSRLREIALGALIFNGISKALRGFVTGMNNALTKSGAFTSALSNLKGAALNAAAPLVSALTPALTAIANAAAIALSYIGRLFAFFSGKSIASLKSTAKAMGGVAAGTNAAKKALAGFDTINTLDTSSGSGGGSASPPSLAYEASNPFLDSLTDAIKGGDWAGAGTMLADKLNSIIAGWDAYGWGQKLGGMLQNGISFAFSFLTTFDWNGLGAKLAGFVNGLLNQVDGAQLGALFASKFTIAIRTLGTFLANLDWAMLSISGHSRSHVRAAVSASPITATPYDSLNSADDILLMLCHGPFEPVSAAFGRFIEVILRVIVHPSGVWRVVHYGSLPDNGRRQRAVFQHAGLKRYLWVTVSDDFTVHERLSRASKGEPVALKNEAGAVKFQACVKFYRHQLASTYQCGDGRPRLSCQSSTVAVISPQVILSPVAISRGEPETASSGMRH